MLSISDLVASVLRPRASLLRRIASGVLLLLLLSSSSYADFPVTVSTDYDAEFARAADLLEDGKRAEAEAILEAIRHGAKLPSWDARAALLLAVDDERHEEARRFARLLVSEIKLYNERAVMEGRERGNLYQRLREDIDRSRQMYDERIPQDVRSQTNFFYDELVRILADGRQDALGMSPPAN